MTPAERAFATALQDALKATKEAGGANGLILAQFCAAAAGGLIGGDTLPDTEAQAWLIATAQQMDAAYQQARSSAMVCVGTA